MPSLRTKSPISRRAPAARLVVLASWLLLANRTSAEPLAPPKPNPADPVNYVEWMNKNLGGDVPNSAHKDYLAASELITRFVGELPVEVTSGPWSGNQPVADWLSANSKALQKFRLGATRRACFFPMALPKPSGDARTDGSLLRVELPFMGPHRTAVMALVCEGYQAWKKGDRALLPKNVIVVLRAAHHLDSHPTLIARLVGTACAALGYEALLDALQLSDKPDALAADVGRDLDKADPPTPPLADLMRYERLFGWDFCQRIFIPGDKPGTWKLHDPLFDQLKQMGAADVADKAAIAKLGFDATFRELDAYYDAVEAWMRKPHTVAAREASELSALMERSKNALVKMLVPSLTRSKLLETRLTAHRRATHLVVHLLAQHGRDGKLPEKLDQLEIPDLAELRIDPFSGKDFVYKRTGDGFQLYSLSDNSKDDGGKHNEKWEEGDYVFWPRPAKR